MSKASGYFMISSFANFRRSCFCPMPVKNTMAFLLEPSPEILSTLPFPKLACLTCIPVCISLRSLALIGIFFTLFMLVKFFGAINFLVGAEIGF